MKISEKQKGKKDKPLSEKHKQSISEKLMACLSAGKLSMNDSDDIEEITIRNMAGPLTYV